MSGFEKTLCDLCRTSIRVKDKSAKAVCGVCSANMKQAQLIAMSAHAESEVSKRMVKLCLAFHVLHHLPGTNPWDPELLAAECFTGDSAQRHAIMFVLDVWNSGTWARDERKEKFGVESFDFLTAIHTWDLQNRAAFIGFAMEPFGT